MGLVTIAVILIVPSFMCQIFKQDDVCLEKTEWKPLQRFGIGYLTVGAYAVIVLGPLFLASFVLDLLFTERVKVGKIPWKPLCAVLAILGMTYFVLEPHGWKEYLSVYLVAATIIIPCVFFALETKFWWSKKNENQGSSCCCCCFSFSCFVVVMVAWSNYAGSGLSPFCG